MFSWGAAHPPCGSAKILGGGHGNKTRDRERRVVVRTVRKCFPHISWQALRRKLARDHGVVLSDKTIKSYCALSSSLSRSPLGNFSSKFNAHFRNEAIKLVVGTDRRDVHGDRKNPHSIRVACHILLERHGRAPGRPTLSSWVTRAGFLYKFRAKNIRLEQRHLDRREAFCDEVESKTATEWEVVVFSDSTYISRNHVPIPRNDGCFCLVDEEPCPKGTFRHPATTHVYGAITPFGLVGPYFTHKVNARIYLPILKRMLKDVAKIFSDNGLEDQFTFQQDGAPAHTSNLVQDWIAEQHDYDVWGKDAWPPCSPDLSIIENVWADMQRIVSPYEKEAKTQTAFEARIVNFFREFSSERCIALYCSIPKRMDLLRAAGFKTISC